MTIEQWWIYGGFEENFSVKKGGACMTVAKLIELVGESEISWDDAVSDAVQKASQSVSDITGVEILNFTAQVKDGEVVGYKANVKLAFGVRDEE